MSDTTSDTNIVTSKTVTFTWSTQHGFCYECGLPAAYSVEGGHRLRCCVCAAEAASEGVKIVRLPDTTWKITSVEYGA